MADFNLKGLSTKLAEATKQVTSLTNRQSQAKSELQATENNARSLFGSNLVYDESDNFKPTEGENGIQLSNQYQQLMAKLRAEIKGLDPQIAKATQEANQAQKAYTDALSKAKEEEMNKVKGDPGAEKAAADKWKATEDKLNNERLEYANSDSKQPEEKEINFSDIKEGTAEYNAFFDINGDGQVTDEEKATVEKAFKDTNNDGKLSEEETKATLSATIKGTDNKNNVTSLANQFNNYYGFNDTNKTDPSNPFDNVYGDLELTADNLRKKGWNGEKDINTFLREKLDKSGITTTADTPTTSASSATTTLPAKDETKPAEQKTDDTAKPTSASAATATESTTQASDKTTPESKEPESKREETETLKFNGREFKEVINPDLEKEEISELEKLREEVETLKKQPNGGQSAQVMPGGQQVVVQQQTGSTGGGGVMGFIRNVLGFPFKLIGGIVNGIGNIASNIGGLISGSPSTGAPAGQTVVVTNGAQQAGGGFDAGAPVTYTEAAANQQPSLLSRVGNGIADFCGSLWGGAKNVTQSLWGGAKTVTSTAWKPFDATLTGAGNIISSGANLVADGFKAGSRALFNGNEVTVERNNNDGTVDVKDTNGHVHRKININLLNFGSTIYN